jgi:aspartate aminotransferase
MPAHIVEAATRSLRDRRVGYLPAGGLPALRDALREKFARHGQVLSDSQIVVGAGCKQVIFAAFCATIDPGDDVIVPAPYWLSYPEIATLFGGRTVKVPCSQDDGFKISPERLAGVLMPKTKWVVINSPGNPGGAIYSIEELRALGEVLQAFPKCLILSDEIYENYVYDGMEAASFAVANPGLADRVVTVNGMSKTFAMPGLRVGYGAAPKPIATAMTAIIAQDTSCAASSSQYAALAGLTGDQSWIGSIRVDYQERRDRLVPRLNAIPGFRCAMPRGAYYAFPSIAGLMGMQTPDGVTLTSDADVVRFLADEAGVLTAGGSAYGARPFLRLSFSTSLENIDKACLAIGSAMEKLRRRT